MTDLFRCTFSGTAAIIWDCNSQPNQQWSLNADEDHRSPVRLCLDAVEAGTANGTKLNLLPRRCSGGRPRFGSTD